MATFNKSAAGAAYRRGVDQIHDSRTRSSAVYERGVAKFRSSAAGTAYRRGVDRFHNSPAATAGRAFQRNVSLRLRRRNKKQKNDGEQRPQ